MRGKHPSCEPRRSKQRLGHPVEIDSSGAPGVEDVGVQERPLEEVIAEFFTTNAERDARE